MNSCDHYCCYCDYDDDSYDSYDSYDYEYESYEHYDYDDDACLGGYHVFMNWLEGWMAEWSRAIDEYW